MHRATLIQQAAHTSGIDSSVALRTDPDPVTGDVGCAENPVLLLQAKICCFRGIHQGAENSGKVVKEEQKRQ